MSAQEELGRETVEQSIPPEYAPRVYGEKHIAPVGLRYIHWLSQMRAGINPEASAIAESIERNDLINQIDVARMPLEAFEEYIEFVNEVWHAEHTTEGFEPAPDGFYYLVIAGHTRVQAIHEIEQVRSVMALTAGHETDPLSAQIWCKLHTAISPAEIIALQLDENLHNKPPIERTAMAIVETFFYGQKTGQWENPSEFLRVSGDKFSPYELRNALAFVDLPVNLREFVFAGGIPFLAGVELSKTLPVYKKHALFKYFSGKLYEELSPGEQLVFNSQCEDWAGSEIAIIQEHKVNGTAAKKRFQSYRSNWREEMEAAVDDTEPVLFELDDGATAWKQHRRRTREKYHQSLRALLDISMDSVAATLPLHLQLFGETPEASEIAKKAAVKAQKIAENLGHGSLMLVRDSD